MKNIFSYAGVNFANQDTYFPPLFPLQNNTDNIYKSKGHETGPGLIMQSFKSTGQL